MFFLYVSSDDVLAGFLVEFHDAAVDRLMFPVPLLRTGLREDHEAPAQHVGDDARRALSILWLRWIEYQLRIPGANVQDSELTHDCASPF
jgi:hypothetical protein